MLTAYQDRLARQVPRVKTVSQARMETQVSLEVKALQAHPEMQDQMASPAVQDLMEIRDNQEIKEEREHVITAHRHDSHLDISVDTQ